METDYAFAVTPKKGDSVGSLKRETYDGLVKRIPHEERIAQNKLRSPPPSHSSAASNVTETNASTITLDPSRQAGLFTVPEDNTVNFGAAMAAAREEDAKLATNKSEGGTSDTSTI